MSVTIKDVAEKAGVAPSTVSRVIADSQRISEETRQRVRRVMDELGYHPNAIARSLANRSTSTLGLIMPRSAEKLFVNPFFPEVMRGINVVAYDNEFDLLMSSGADAEEEEVAVRRMVRGGRVDGVILLCSRVSDNLITRLSDQSFPFVVIGRPVQRPEEVNWVDNDNVAAAKRATEHLIELGHHQIGFISGSMDLVVSRDRLEGYRKAVEANGLQYDANLVTEGRFEEKTGIEAISRLLALKDRPTAVVATDDLIAFGIIQKILGMGYGIPEDLSVVGFNNSLLSQTLRPSLTSVDIQIFELGRHTAELLIRQLRNPDRAPESVIIENRLVVRESTGAGPHA